jgi:hypothetical protein
MLALSQGEPDWGHVQHGNIGRIRAAHSSGQMDTLTDAVRTMVCRQDGRECPGGARGLRANQGF